jgi:hypothetical protein
MTSDDYDYDYDYDHDSDLSRHSFPATAEVFYFLIFLLRSAKFKSAVKPAHSKDAAHQNPRAGRLFGLRRLRARISSTFGKYTHSRID